MPKKPCAHPGCSVLLDIGTTYCPRHHVLNKNDSAKPTDKKRTARPWQRWYNLKAWRKGRRLPQLAKEPLCALCPPYSRQQATVADHVVPHRGDYSLFWFGELQSLCTSCHGSKKQKIENRSDRSGDREREFRERRMPSTLMPSRIPLIIVCGPPASGKSTYVRQRAKANDLVIDLDAIMQGLTGLPEHHTDKRYLRPALERRNRMLQSLAKDEEHLNAWFIISAADQNERRDWHRMLGGKLVVLDVSLKECTDRINADPTRAGHRARMISAATIWWQKQAPRGV